MFESPSIEARLDQVNHRPAGFDYMRLILAISVIVFHSIGVSYGYAYQEQIMSGPWHSVLVLILPVFFSLSGFLVSGSLERSKTLFNFFGLRVLRIVPALSVEVVLSALLLGPIFTTAPLSVYFTAPEFYSYFLNILGEIHYVLPGVFPNNPHPNVVNAQLWTVPYELLCYLVLGALAFFGAFKHRGFFILAILAVYPYLVYLSFTEPRGMTNGLSGNLLVLCFLWGVALYRYRDKLPWSLPLFLVSAVIALGLNLFPNGDRFSHLPMAYCTVYLGLLNPPRTKLLLSGDYSYGLYLYGGPVQQAIASLGPAYQQWWINLALAGPALAGLAAFSWWCIEKPTLAWRRYLKAFDEWYLPRRAALLGRLPKAPGRPPALESPREALAAKAKIP